MKRIDWATVGGLLTVTIMITAAYVMSGGSLLMILDLPAMMIVIGGTLGASVVGSSLDDCYELGTLLRINFLSSEIRFHEVVSTLVHCARTARKSGLLSIQASVNPRCWLKSWNPTCRSRCAS